MEKNIHKISEGSTYGREGHHFQRFIQKLRTLTAGRSAGILGHRRRLPPDADPGVSVRQLFLGSLHGTRAARWGHEPGRAALLRRLAAEAEQQLSPTRFWRRFLGSTLEFMQREYFSEPQPKKSQRHDTDY
jgi:hypothetical protein